MSNYPKWFIENIPLQLNTLLPDYHNKIKEFHRLMDKRGDLTSNLTLHEAAVYNHLLQWYDDNHRQY